MHRRIPRVAHPSFLALALTSVALGSLAAERACDGVPLRVEAGTSAVEEELCAAAAGATGVLASMGIAPRGGLAIRTVQRLPGDEFAHGIGRYDARRNEIQLLDYPSTLAASREQSPAFGLPMSKPLWHSYLVHELAHAAAEPLFAEGAPRFAASEYIAAVAQMAFLPPALREVVLQRYRDASPFEDPLEITSLFYLMDPCRFTVKSYLHYGRPGAGPGFVKRLLREGLSD